MALTIILAAQWPVEAPAFVVDPPASGAPGPLPERRSKPRAATLGRQRPAPPTRTWPPPSDRPGDRPALTGRQVTLQGIDIVRVGAGRITERWGEFDALDLLAQPGATAGAG